MLKKVVTRGTGMVLKKGVTRRMVLKKGVTRRMVLKKSVTGEGKGRRGQDKGIRERDR